MKIIYYIFFLLGFLPLYCMERDIILKSCNETFKKNYKNLMSQFQSCNDFDQFKDCFSKFMEKILTKRNQNQVIPRLQNLALKSYAKINQPLPDFEFLELEDFLKLYQLQTSLPEKYSLAIKLNEKDQKNEYRHQLIMNHSDIKKNLWLLLQTSELDKNEYFEKCKNDLEKQIKPYFDFSDENFKEEYNNLHKQLKQQCKHNFFKFDNMVFLFFVGIVFFCYSILDPLFHNINYS